MRKALEYEIVWSEMVGDFWNGGVNEGGILGGDMFCGEWVWL